MNKKDFNRYRLLVIKTYKCATSQQERFMVTALSETIIEMQKKYKFIVSEFINDLVFMEAKEEPTDMQLEFVKRFSEKCTWM